MKKTYSQVILELLNHRYPEWVYSYEMVAKHTPFGWLGTSADRIARDMAREGLIEREGRDEGKFYARYRAIIKATPSPLKESEMYDLFEPKTYPQGRVEN